MKTGEQVTALPERSSCAQVIPAWLKPALPVEIPLIIDATSTPAELPVQQQVVGLLGTPLVNGTYAYLDVTGVYPSGSSTAPRRECCAWRSAMARRSL
jgi:hypothetical protein